LTSQGIRTYEKAIKGVTTVLNSITMVLMAVMMFLGAADVVGRYIFNRPIIRTLEMSEVILVSMSMLGLARTQLAKGHIKLEYFTARLSP